MAAVPPAAAAAVPPAGAAPVPVAPPPPALYVPLVGNATVPDGITEDNSMTQIIWWVGFRTNAQLAAMINDGIDSWDSIKMLTTGDVDSMAKSFGSRTAATGRVNFGTNRTKFLKAMVNWVQDFYRVSDTPTIVGLNENAFKQDLRTAESRDKIRKTLKENTIPSDASPGPLERESKWKEWEDKFVNYLRLHLGASGIPLSYVVRENNNPDTSTNTDFISRTITRAPLSGEYYDADKLTVFNFIVSFTTGQPSGDWVKSTIRQSNGRISMKALRDHFLGEGNATRSLTTAESLRASLHYKNERSITFETFLTQCQRMFNIFAQEKEPMSEDAKIRFVFKAIQHKDLRFTVEALDAKRAIGTSNLTYTACCNHLTTAVSQLPEYKQRNDRMISGVSVGAVNNRNSSIYNEDGTINATGTIKDWDSLPMSDKRIVFKERKRLGVKFGGASNAKGTKTNTNANTKNTVNQLRKLNNNLKRRIKALQVSDSDKDKVSNNEIDDAGDEFGGKNSKKKRPNNV